MSYLDLPRIHFGGAFQASPSTINNAPDNYDPANYNDSSLKPENIELYWEPKGDGIFDLVNCKVTTVEMPSAQAGTETLVGAPVVALYTGAPPKLVDLDPMQQNGSELWGLTMMFGGFDGSWVQGTFEPIAFNGIWGNSQGPNTPRNSASGAATYLSTLTNLKWNVGNSTVLKALQAQSPRRLSVRMVVSAHNNAPVEFLFDAKTFSDMASAGVPQDVLSKIVSLQDYTMNFPPVGPGRGHIPTQAYVNFLLEQLLGQSTAAQWGPTILATTQQPYVAWIDYGTKEPLPEQPYYDFNYGKIIGSLGPCADDEPTFVVPARTLAPNPAPQRKTTSTNPPSPPSPACWWASAKLDLDVPSLTLDLADSLPVPLPGRPLWAEALGKLSLAYYTVSATGQKEYTVFVDSIDYANPDFIDKQGGMLVVTDFGGLDPKSLAQLPLAVLSTVPGQPCKSILEENAEGLSLRADQFLFRMNPGLPTTPGFNRGETNSVDIYVRKFGEVDGTGGLQVQMAVLDPDQAFNYTLSTLGTSGTNGISADNTSTPPGKLTFVSETVPVSNGKASFTIEGSDPGNPRGFVDGQVYFATYDFNPPVTGFHQDPNDLVSVQIYQQTPITGTPTWDNGIGEILRQYGMLYPIMGRFELWSYAGVKQNREKIERVFRMDFGLPLHMPVTRDLSDIRRKLILDWFDAGMPER